MPGEERVSLSDVVEIVEFPFERGEAAAEVPDVDDERDEDRAVADEQERFHGQSPSLVRPVGSVRCCTVSRRPLSSFTWTRDATRYR